MANEQEISLRNDVKQLLEKIQQFDTSKLPREQELGQLNFKDAVVPAERLIALYRRISLPTLDDLPQNQLSTLRERIVQDAKRLESILTFNLQQSNAYQNRNEMIRQLDACYQETFGSLWLFVAYSVSKSTDFKGLEREAKATIQTVQEEGKKLADALAEQNKEAGLILENVRKLAEEQGVSQQAIYFRTSAEEHEKQASGWYEKTRLMAWVLALYAVVSLFFHKWFATDGVYGLVQLGISKVLIFGVISFMLYLFARNFLAQKHNAIVNRHRQNALMTFTALVDAAKEIQKKEVILTHASACIFSPQPTGYTGSADSGSPNVQSVVEVLSKSMHGEGQG